MKRCIAILLAAAMLALLPTALFGGCYRYTHIVIASQREGDFYCSMYEDYTVEIVKYLGEGGVVTVPANIRERAVVGITTRAFQDCADVEEAYLPSSFTSLPSKLFDTCENLKAVYIPVSVTSIGKNLISDCPSFERILYAGSEAQWNAVSKGNMLTDNYELSNAEIVFNYVPEG